jgi:hypothetical protein
MSTEGAQQIAARGIWGNAEDFCAQKPAEQQNRETIQFGMQPSNSLFLIDLYFS